MVSDPIVAETRRAGERLAAEAGNDLHRFFERLRQAETDCGRPLVNEPVQPSGVADTSSLRGRP